MKLYRLPFFPYSFFIFFIFFFVDVKCEEELEISSVKYDIVRTDLINKIMTIRRKDILDDLCLSKPVNTTLDSSPFQLPLDNSNITLFYGCPPVARGLTCGNDTNNGLYYQMGATGSDQRAPEQFTSFSECATSIVIPAFSTVIATQIENLIQFPPVISALNEVINGGFSVTYEEKYADCVETCISKGRACVDPCQTVGSAAGFCVFLLIIFLSIYRRRKTSSNNSVSFWKSSKQAQKVEDFLSKCGFLAPKRYTYFDIKKMTNSFEDKLGQGGFGGVFKGKLPDGRLVAVKLMRESKGDGEDFINEVASISRTSHVNVVSLLGFCFDDSKRALIYEFMPNGSLEKFIYKDRPLGPSWNLSWEKLYEIVIGIGRGLEYLHRGCNTRIVHFDIKPHNILLDKDFCPKISDFGLAKLCTTKESVISMLGTRGTPGYIAPEVFCRTMGGVSHKSDVYSYGMMVLETVGGRRNIKTEVDHSSEIFFPHWIHKRLELDQDLGLPGVTLETDTVVKKMILVGLWCIQTNPIDRPSMNKVVEMLEGSLESLRIPPKTFLTSPSRSEQSFFDQGSMKEFFLSSIKV
ncbi:hypothetical protein GIB67_028896 [Kingdonia uniflora]|uniref:Protein kinase domain-containing protein n=1 Tax=Kingdonia uniflora TaxID=39325 RepID=A0A7J7LTA7_9MAGN|nr:hypothetical protein GIB67_028896 [Kingdonia uniflora]